MNNKLTINEKSKSILSNIPFTRIAAMLIVAILSCNVSGINSMYVALLFIVITFSVQLILNVKYHSCCDSFKENTTIIYSYIPAVFVFVGFVGFSILSGRNVLYSIAVSLSLSVLVMPHSSNYYRIAAFVLNDKAIDYSGGFRTCFAINKYNSILIDGDDLTLSERIVDSVSTVYDYICCENLNNSEDYAVGILKEFSMILFPECEDYKKFTENTNVSCELITKQKVAGNITYAVVKCKYGFRVIAAGPFEDIKQKCSECASKNSLVSAYENKSLLDESVKALKDRNMDVVAFAFVDCDEFNDFETIDDMIYVGTVGIKTVVDKKSLELLEGINKSNCEIVVRTNGKEDEILDLLNDNNIKCFAIKNGDIVINGFKRKIASVDNEYNQEDAHIKLNECFVLPERVKENCDKICNTSYAIERNFKMFSFSIFISFLTATVLIPNNVMQPYVIVLLSCIIEIFSLFAVCYFKTDKKTPVRNLINTFLISLCGLGLFFTGRFFVDVPLSKYDAEAVNTARSMIVYYYIFLAAAYDSVVIFSNLKKYVNKLIVITSAIVLIIVLNIPVITGVFGLHLLTSQAFKYTLIFAIIPLFINTFGVLTINWKENRTDGK